MAQQDRIAGMHRFIAKNGGVKSAAPIVMNANASGKFAAMVGVESVKHGRYDVLYVGDCKTSAGAQRVATANAIGFASL